MSALAVSKNSVFLNEKCLWNASGCYVGVKTGTRYPVGTHRHCPQLQAVICGVDMANQTGMLHLHPGTEGDADPQENRRSWKEQFIGCLVTVEEAHFYGDKTVYRVLELGGEYFSSDELKILSPPAISPYAR